MGETSCYYEHKPIDTKQSDGHSHRPSYETGEIHRPRQRRAFVLCIILTVSMMVGEFIAGWLTGSLMLTSDAVHMLSHSISLALGLVAILIAGKENKNFSFGLYRVEILVALINGITLAGFSVGIIYESIERLSAPIDIKSFEMIIVALLGLAVNLSTALILHRAGSEDLNTRSVFLHMLADTFSSVAIIAGAVIIHFTKLTIIDPILSIFIALLIAKWSWGLLRSSTMTLLESKPAHLDLREIEETILQEVPEIKNIHDLHVWEITSQFTCFSVHVVVDDMNLKETMPIRERIVNKLRTQFQINHAVIQIEC